MKQITKLLVKTAMVAVAGLLATTLAWGVDYSELYNSGSFTGVETHSYTQNKTFTLNGKSWTASVSQVSGSVFYLGCNNNNASKGILNSNTTFSAVVTALCSADATYNTNKTTAHAYALLFDNAYSNVTKVTFNWSGGNNAFQVYLFGDSGSGYVLLSSTDYATSGTTTAGSVEWTGDATNYSKFAIVARPGATNSTATNKTLRVSSFVIYETDGGGSACATPTFSPAAGEVLSGTTVTLSTETDDATIYYTMGADPANPTSSSTEYTSPIDITSATTIKAIAIKDGLDDSSVASASYTIATPLTTMDDVFSAATTAGSTATSKFITFDDWVISAVNGNNAYITDGTKGAIIYGSGHGFATGDILSGTVSCKVQLYRGSSEITELTSTSTGLTVTKGGTITPVTNVGIAGLSGVNTGAVFSYEGLAYDGSVLSDGVNSITPYTTLYSFTLESGKSYNITGMYLQFDSTKEILPRSASDIAEAVVPTVTTSTSSLSSFSYQVDNGPSEAKSFTVSGSNLSANISLSVTSDYEISLSSGSGYTSSLSIEPTAGEVSSTTVYVRLKADKTVGDYAGTVTLSSTGATGKSVSLSGTVEALNVTWDLSTNSSTSASADLVTWSSPYVTMTLAKGESSTNANNYLASSDPHTRIYKDQILTITPAVGYAATSIVITATTSSYVAGFTGNSWTNASSSTSGTVVTVTPTSGTTASSVIISAACRATSVKVYYEVDTTPSVAVSSNSVGSTASGTKGTITITYLNFTLDEADVNFYAADGTTPATYDWLTASINGDNNVSYVVDPYHGASDRTAYFKVYALDDSSNDYESELITVTQTAYDSGVASLLFAFDGGRDDVAGTSGLMQSGLGTDYSSSPKLKFDDTGDYLVLQFDSQAASVSFDIKTNSFSGGTFKVQESADGINYSDLATYNDEITTTRTENLTPAATTRYIKWIYTLKSSGNIALGNISVEKEASPTTLSLNATFNGGRYWVSFFNSTKTCRLPEGAQAFTMNSDHKLYLLGDDGTVIPKNTAVVIMADSATIMLTVVADTSVSVNGGGNILNGSDSSVDVSALSETPYVLGIKKGELGFYEYTGTDIPAGKAYYEE